MKARDPGRLAYEIADALLVQMAPLEACGLLPDRDALAGVFLPIAAQQAAMDRRIRKLRKQARGLQAVAAKARPPAPGPRLVGLSEADWAQVRQMMTCVNVPEAS